MKEKIHLGQVDSLCDRGKFRALPMGPTQVQRPTHLCNAVHCERSPLDHSLEDHVVGPTSMEQTEVKSLSFPLLGLWSRGRKKSSNVLCDIKEAFVYSLALGHHAPATHWSMHQL